MAFVLNVAPDGPSKGVLLVSPVANECRCSMMWGNEYRFCLNSRAASNPGHALCDLDKPVRFSASVSSSINGH